MERFPNPLDLSNTSIWSRACRKGVGGLSLKILFEFERLDEPSLCHKRTNQIPSLSNRPPIGARGDTGHALGPNGESVAPPLSPQSTLIGWGWLHFEWAKMIQTVAVKLLLLQLTLTHRYPPPPPALCLLRELFSPSGFITTYGIQ